MRPPYRTIRVVVALALLAAFGVLGALSCVITEMVWFCLNPVTGKIDDSIYDETHYVNGVFDPCHCYDPCGPLASCPFVVDAGEPGPGCDAGASDGG